MSHSHHPHSSERHHKGYAPSIQSSTLNFARQNTRQIHVHHPLPNELLDQNKSQNGIYKPIFEYASNKIRTSKYTLISFLPKNFFEQFRRVANSFFLALVLLQSVKEFKTIDPGVAALPIIFIVVLTAIKDGFEDWKRWKSDKLMNERIVKRLFGSVVRNFNVYEEGSGRFWLKWKLLEFFKQQDKRKKEKEKLEMEKVKTGEQQQQEQPSILLAASDPYEQVTWQEVQWQNLRVGDIILIENNDPIPADVLCLATSEPDAISYIETKNLDGETNLKLRQAPLETAWVQSPQDASRLKLTLDSEGPSVYMLRYQASLHVFLTGHERKSKRSELGSISSGIEDPQVAKKIPIDMNNLLLRGCVLRNTKWVIGLVIFTGDDTKQLMNSGKIPSKRSKVEKQMNPHVAFNLLFMFILCLGCSLAYGFYLSQVPVTPFLSLNENNSSAYEAFIDFWNELIIFQNIVPISLYITVEIVKTLQAYFIHSDIEMYYEKNDTPCNPRSWNLSDNLGQIEYIFSDKTGTLTRNIMAYKKCSIDGKIYGHSTGNEMVESPTSKTTIPSPLNKSFVSSKSIFSFKNAWMEGQHESAAQRELNRSHKGLPQPTTPTTPTTPTPSNQLQPEHPAVIITSPSFHKQSSFREAMGQKKEEEEEGSWFNQELEAILNNPEKQSTPHALMIRDFFTLLSVCHTVLVDELQSDPLTTSTTGDTTDTTTTTEEAYLEKAQSLKPKTIAYKAQSPDEACLVTTAAENGFIFKGRVQNQELNQNEILVEILGKEERFALLHVLEFDSDRKRMSVICRKILDSDGSSNGGGRKGDVILFCKGADSVIFERLLPGQQEICQLTSKHLERFAEEGLRTLCLGYRKIHEEFYRDWSVRYLEALTQFYPDPAMRAKTLDSLHSEVECKLILLGATAIEDKLQDGVPECIQTLSNAGIKVWVLTGDKIETAINVGFLCGLLKTTDIESEDAEMILIQVKNASTEEEVNRQMKTALERFWGESERFNKSLMKQEFALIIDGSSLKVALETTQMQNLFLDLSCRCKAVICCRVSPLQKAKVVELVKREKKVLTLAIGDGANDVSMIQSADVGVGISGEEGLQAAMTADYSIAQFKYLCKLLLVHGRWSYSRISNMILNFYLKSIVFTLVLFWFQFYCTFSSSIIYDFNYMLYYNLVFTMLPIMVMGIFDQNIDKQTLMKFPQITLSEGIRQTFYTHQKFISYLLESIWQSLICFYLPVMTYGEGPSNVSGLTISSVHLGTVMAVSAIITVNLSVALDVHCWTWITHLCIWGSCALIFLYILLFSFVPETTIEGLTPELYPDLMFWLNILIGVLLSLGPRFCYYALRRMFKPCDEDLLGEIQQLTYNNRVPIENFLPISQPSTPVPSTPKSEKNMEILGTVSTQKEEPVSAIIQKVRRLSNSSTNSISYSMETGAASKPHGFSFSHTLGMGGVILKHSQKRIRNITSLGHHSKTNHTNSTSNQQQQQ